MTELEIQLSTTGARKCLAWLQFCKSIGWKSEDMPFLQDLWCKHRDRDGRLRESAKALPQEGKTK